MISQGRHCGREPHCLKPTDTVCWLSISYKAFGSPMNKVLITIGFLCSFLIAQSSYACGGAFHLYMDPDDYGVVGGTLIRLAGLAPPEPVFKLKHKPVAKVSLEEEHQLVIEYKRPWFSNDVSLSFVGTPGIQLKDEKVELEDYSGEVVLNYSLHNKGYNTIKLVMSGEHKGKTVERSTVVYVQAKKEKPPEVAQVSAPHN